MRDDAFMRLNGWQNYRWNTETGTIDLYRIESLSPVEEITIYQDLREAGCYTRRWLDAAQLLNLSTNSGRSGCSPVPPPTYTKFQEIIRSRQILLQDYYYYWPRLTRLEVIPDTSEISNKMSNFLGSQRILNSLA